MKLNAPGSACFALLTLLHLSLAGRAQAGNGDPVDGHPTWRERAILALSNACRQGPEQYRDTYLRGARILRARNYPPVPPLYASLPLERAARTHSEDMARTPCFQHDSCDGTSIWKRIRRYYPGAVSMAENIANGYRSPLEVVNGWLLDGGAADRSAGDGHRRSLLSAKFREAGIGSAEGGPRETYDTQDFGSGEPDFDTPLVSGAHVLAAADEITFLASYRAADAEPPAGAFVEIDGKQVAMTLAFGSERSGTYRALLRRADHCRRYRFQFEDHDGRTWRYPEEGSLFTTGEGGCTREYERGE